MTKIIRLNIEEIKLKKEIKANESKILKSVIINTNDVSQTRNDILFELNTILNAEASNRNKKESKHIINLEENRESKNIKLKIELEENKQIKCNFF